MKCAVRQSTATARQAHRRMACPAFRADQHARLHEAHIKPITDLVEELSRVGNNGFIPYVAPLYGGINAEVLLIFQDPGPKTQSGTGSGMLCAENDDPTADLFSNCLDAARLDVARTITWNAYPWYINKSPTASQLEAGLMPLRRLLFELRKVSVVMLMGRRAEDSWKRFRERYPTESSRYKDIASLHPSRRGITRGGRTSRDVGIKQLTADLTRAKAVIDSNKCQPGDLCESSPVTVSSAG
jgi:hypothetical protein